MYTVPSLPRAGEEKNELEPANDQITAPVPLFRLYT